MATCGGWISGDREHRPDPDIGTVHHETDHQAERINDDVALAAFGLLARIIAPDTATFLGFDALAIDHAGRWTGPPCPPVRGLPSPNDG